MEKQKNIEDKTHIETFPAKVHFSRREKGIYIYIPKELIKHLDIKVGHVITIGLFHKLKSSVFNLSHLFGEN